jgi:hypothetical protein
MNDPLVPTLMIVAGLAMLAVLFRLGDLRKRHEPLHRLDDVAALLDDARSRIRGGEEFSARTARDLRRGMESLADVLERFAPPETPPPRRSAGRLAAFLSHLRAVRR